MKKKRFISVLNGYISRKILHFVSGGVLAILAFNVEPHKMVWFALAGFFIVIGFETIRLKTIAKHYVNGAIDYLLKREERGKFNGVFWGSCAVLLVSLFASPFALSYGFAVLAFADPAAALIGKFTSSNKVHKKKTINGSLAFLIVTSVVSFFYLSMVGNPYLLILSIIMGGVLTLVEMFSDPLDDNFTILLFASILMTSILV